MRSHKQCGHIEMLIREWRCFKCAFKFVCIILQVAYVFFVLYLSKRHIFCIFIAAAVCAKSSSYSTQMWPAPSSLYVPLELLLLKD